MAWETLAAIAMEIAPMTDTIHDRIIQPKPRDIGGFSVRRSLPHAGRRTVGPFIFFDHMGPATFPPGAGIDVRPHPHIGLATVTYLFSGEIVHRDSLGVVQPIRPGDVNWMTAGSGIVHSERTDPARRDGTERLHGIQTWVALPKADEEIAPAFVHHPARTLPEFADGGAVCRVIAGTAYGHESPVAVFQPTLYVDVSQNISRKPWSKALRCFTTSSLIYMFEHDRILFDEEKFRLLGFGDDVELLFDAPSGAFQVRSASRLGRRDYGVNRARVEKLRRLISAAPRR